MDELHDAVPLPGTPVVAGLDESVYFKTDGGRGRIR